MGTIFLFVMLIAEVLLAALTLAKHTDKSVWLKNRLIFRFAEAGILLGLKILPVTNQEWRFAPALAFLFILSVCDLIEWLIKRKKTVGKKIKARAVVSCVLSVLFVFTALIPAFIFSNYNGLPTTGEYTVKETSAILVNEALLDPFEADGSNREVPIHFYYPESAEGEFPLVVFSHGAFGYYQSNVSTYMELASNGYVVAALDHPHHSIFTQDTQGNTIIVDQKFMSDVNMISNEDITEEQIYEITKEWMELRTSDENFVIDTIEDAKKSGSLSSAWHTQQANTIQAVINMTDIEKIGLMGHSMGGATSVEIGRERSDIDAVIDIDGTMLSERISVTNGKYNYNKEPYPIPILDFTKEKDYNEREQFKDTNGYAYVNEETIENAKDGKTVVFSGVLHMDFTDLPLFAPKLAAMLDGGTSQVDNAEFMTLVNSIVLNWFDYYLKNEGTLDIQANY